MLIFAAVMWTVALGVFAYGWFRRDARLRLVFPTAARNSRIFIGIVPMALLAAGFLSPLIPADLVARWLGQAAGFESILIATVVGWCIPVPPVIFFSIIAVLLKAGAGLPQMAALVVGWNVFALHRTFAMELPIVGARFVAVRLGSNILLPPVAGVIAIGVVRVLGLSG